MAAQKLNADVRSDSDEEIAVLVQKGRDEEFAVLISRYEPKLLRYARKFLFDFDDAQDVVQETFIKAFRNIEGFDAGRKFSPWIYRIAHNECVNFIKKNRIEKVPLFDLDVLFPHVPKEKHEDEKKFKQMKEILDASIGKLDIKYREPLLLYYIEGFDYREIADILRVPVATVGVRLSRGRKYLKSEYEKQDKPAGL